MNRVLDHLAKTPPWLYLAVFGIITFFAHPISVPSDLKVYSCNALNIYLGKGYVDIDGSLVLFRGPIFPFMISISYWLFGVSHQSTFWVIKLFCILNPIVVYAIGYRLFSKRIGVSSALFILTSYAINFWSFRHLDAVWPFFVLLSTLSIYIGFEDNKTRYFVLAGISLALAFLVKEVSILFFPVPFLMLFLISDYRKKKYITKILLGYTVVFLSILPWLWYRLLNGYSFGLELLIGKPGRGGIKTLGLSSIGDSQNFPWLVLNKFQNWCAGLWNYYHDSLSAMDQWFTLAPLFIVAWCFIFLGAIRGNKQFRILIIHALLFLPVIYLQGSREMRGGQTLIIYILSYLVVAVFIDSMLKMISQNIVTVTDHAQKFFLIAVAVIILVQTFVSFRKDPGNKAFLEKSMWCQKITGKEMAYVSDKDLSIADDPDFLDIITQFSTPPNRLYMVSTDRSLAKEVYFNLKGRNPIYYLQSQIHQAFKNEESPYLKEQPVYLKVVKQPGMARHLHKEVYESQIVELVKNENITHIVAELSNRGLSRYLSVWKNLKRIPVQSSEFSIYKVLSNDTSPPELPPIMDMESIINLKKMAAEKRKKNLDFLKSCFIILFPFEKYIKQEDTARDNATISEDRNEKASALNNIGMKNLNEGNYEKAIEHFKQAIFENPEFSEGYTNLFFTNALLERQKSISLNPENPVSYFHYAIFLEAHQYVETALFYVQKAVHLDPNCAEAYLLLGSLYMKQKKYREAIDAFNKTLSIYQKFFGPRKKWMFYTNYVFIGDSYAQLGDLSKAKEFYERAVLVDYKPTESNPKGKRDAYYKLGLLYKIANDHDSAIQNFRYAIRLDPNFSEAYYHLSHSYLLAGDQKTASNYYIKLKKMDSDLADKLNKNLGYIF